MNVDIMIGQQLHSRRPRPWTVFLWVLVAVVLLLAIANGVLAVLLLLDRPSVPLAGELVYATTFDTYNEQWTQYEAQSGHVVRDGALYINLDEVGAIYADLDRTFTDFDMTVNASWMETPDAFSQLGVYFRLQDKRNYYVLSLRGDGGYQVAAVRDGVEDVVSLFHYTPALRTELNAVNRIRIVAKGGEFTFYINEQPLNLCLKGADRRSVWQNFKVDECLSGTKTVSSSMTDGTFPAGKIALGASANTPGVLVTFDNLLVIGPE
jgi:hypothetical protein